MLINFVDEDNAVYVAELKFNPQQPWELQLQFGENNVWTIDRSIADDAVFGNKKAGLFDVQMWPVDYLKVALRLENASASIKLTSATSKWRFFLWNTYKQVPRGEEFKQVDWDAVLG